MAEENQQIFFEMFIWKIYIFILNMIITWYRKCNSLKYY